MQSLVSECKGEYGTKISALVTDIKRRTRAGQTTFKAIVFSAWNQLLHIVQKYVFTFLLSMHLISDGTCFLHHRAFTENDIAYVSLLGGASERATTLEEFRKPIDDALKRPRIMLMSLKNNEGNAYFSSTRNSRMHMHTHTYRSGRADTDDGRHGVSDGAVSELWA